MIQTHSHALSRIILDRTTKIFQFHTTKKSYLGFKFTQLVRF